MEFAVQQKPFAVINFRLIGGMFGEFFFQHLHILGFPEQYHLLHYVCFQGLPDAEQLPGLLESDLLYVEPLKRDGRHEAFMFQAIERVDDRCRRHIESPAEIAVGQFLAGRQFLMKDHLLDLLICLPGQHSFIIHGLDFHVHSSARLTTLSPSSLLLITVTRPVRSK